MLQSPSATGPRFGLAVAHPGHELRLTGWMERARPTVFVLTSGSRSGEDCERVAASRSLAETLGARPGGLFGECLDRDVYAWIMAGDGDRFVDLAHRLADLIVGDRLDALVTDAWQLYNVAHDLWHLVTRAAAAEASLRLGWDVACYDYAVVPPAMSLRPMGETYADHRLGEDELRRKMQLAAAFPAIAGDVAEVVEAGGSAFLAAETLHLPPPLADLLPRPGEKPSYEHFGEQRVRSGRYGSVLRWAHAAPIVAALEPMLALRKAAA